MAKLNQSDDTFLFTLLALPSLWVNFCSSSSKTRRVRASTTISQLQRAGIVQISSLAMSSERGFVFQLVKSPQFKGLSMPRWVVSVEKGSQKKILDSR
uniref:Uncharacterized protein n=1 Tax=Nelumbo nucifera TaxID=4432 RepID=A0A822YVL8_NELNU|nr:TPA_asm: hypothetical protein HUJ06_012139 [Nelumbo nucifera]